MTMQQLLDTHHESNHPCTVHAGPAPSLVVTCDRCEGRLEADWLTPCSGGRQDGRLVLMLVCRSCGATGQLRFAREAPWTSAPPPSPAVTACVRIVAGGSGYVHVSCCDASAVGVFVFGHTTTATELVLDTAVQRCGHRFQLVVPRAPGFRVGPHRHS